MNVRQGSPGSALFRSTKQRNATFIGVAAILMWSSLALVTKMTGEIPPFQLLFLSFATAFAASVVLMMFKGSKSFLLWKQPVNVWIFSFAAIFIYHALYFFALGRAPAAEASLLAYLWPLLIVIFSTIVDRSAIRPRHVIGTLLGFAGAALVMADRLGHDVDAAHYQGYGAALLCALVWSTYSVLNRRFREVPSESMGGVCGLVAAAALVAHLLAETTVAPAASQWVGIVLLGVGPVGLAFFAWDYATKHGHLPTIGALSYVAPLLSTLLLVASGLAPASWGLAAASLLTVSGAVIATLDLRQFFSDSNSSEARP